MQCADPFHVVKWATVALDEVRRQAWNEARRSGQTRGKGYRNRVAIGDVRRFKTRYALWKNPDNLTERQRDKLAWIAKTDPRLHRAYLLKEGLRFVFQVKGEAGRSARDRWLCWARRCRIPAPVRSAPTTHPIFVQVQPLWVSSALSDACTSIVVGPKAAPPSMMPSVLSEDSRAQVHGTVARPILFSGGGPFVSYWPALMSVPTTKVPSLNVAPAAGGVGAGDVAAFVGVGAGAVTVCTTVEGAKDTETVTGAGLAAAFVVFDEDALPMPMPIPMSNARMPTPVGRTQVRRHQGRFGG